MGIKRKEKEDEEAKVEPFEDIDYFKKGSLVEVSLEDEGFRGSWYSATVLRSVSRRSNKLFLEFHTLMADNNNTKNTNTNNNGEQEGSKKPLREFVDVILVRPLPPRESKRSFSLNEEVDAFHNDGWWEGIITDIYDDVGKEGGGRNYSVFFRCSREQIEFGEADLRLHREWVYGKWVPPLEELADAPPPPPPSVS